MSDSEIVRRVTVCTNRGPKEALKATKHSPITNDLSMSFNINMPPAKDESVEVVLFTLEYVVTGNDEFLAEFEDRGLKPVGPIELSAVNEADPDFSREHPNVTQWQDDKGEWYFLGFEFNKVHAERVYQFNQANGGSWLGGCWFAGIRE